jgi:hypothetical protein
MRAEDHGAFREEQTIVTVEVIDLGREPAGPAGILVGRPTRRRDHFEALGLLLGMLGVLLIVALVFGVAPPG